MKQQQVALVIGAALVAGLVGGPASVAHATASEVLGAGPDAGGVVIADHGAGSSGTSTGPVTRRDDGGGGSFWQWGVGKDDAWSNYFRERRCHGATAVGLKSKRVTGVRGGKYALATTPKARSGNKAFYHNC